MALDLIAEGEYDQPEILHIFRQVYTEQQLSKKYQYSKTKSSEKKTTCCTPCNQYLSKKWNLFQSKVTCRSAGRWALSFFPILFWLPKYRLKKDLLKDFSAGLTLGVMQIPQGMAYAMLTTLPPITGLYVSLIPILVYMVLGTSPHLSVGTFAVVSLMVGESVQGHVEPVMADMHKTGANISSTFESDLRIKYAVATSLAVGLLQFFMGLFRIGFITIYLSDSLISGFTTAAGFHILTSQVKHFFGLAIPRDKTSGFVSLFKTYYYIFADIAETNVCSLITGIVCAIILFVIKYLAQKYAKKLRGVPVPAELIVVALGAGISYGASFKERFKIKILDNVPKGMPPAAIPDVTLLGDVIGDAVIIAIVSFAINISLSKAFAKKNNYTIDANQELYAYSGMNIVGSFLSCFTSAASLSRSLIQENLGSTQIAGLFSSILIVLTLVVLAPIFEPLPNAVLAAIVLVALKGVFRQFTVVKRLWRISKVDLFVWMAAFIAVILLGVDFGLGVGLAVNIMTTVVRNSWPSSDVVGQIQDSEVYKSKDTYYSSDIPGVYVFQYHGPLFYANVEHFQTSIYRKIMNPLKCEIVELETSKAPDQSDQEDDQLKVSSHASQYIGRRTRRNTAPELPGLSLAHTVATRLSKSEDTTDKLLLSHISRQRYYPRVAAKDGRMLELMHTLVIDCSRIAYVDVMGVSAISAIVAAYKKRKVHVLLSNCSENLQQMLEVAGFIETYGEDVIYVTVQDAVLAATRASREYAISPIVKKAEHLFEETITNSTIGTVLAYDIPTGESMIDLNSNLFNETIDEEFINPVFTNPMISESQSMV